MQIFEARDFLRCPKCFEELSLDSAGTFFECKKDSSHTFPIINGIPSFVRRDEISPEDAKWVLQYDEMAEKYDEAIRLYDVWLGVNLKQEFRKVIEHVPIRSGQRILDVSCGTGAVFLFIKEVYPNVDLELVGIALSMGMLRVAQRKFTSSDMKVLLLHTQVKELPFKDESFDIITHSGGINTFADITAALKEWGRVLRPEGTLFIVDEGLSPTARKTWRGVQIVKQNKLFGLQPPLDNLPPQLKKVELRWIFRDTFYTISCQKLSKKELEQIKTNGTEHIQISEMVESYQKKLRDNQR